MASFRNQPFHRTLFTWFYAMMLLVNDIMIAQVNLEWVARYNGPANEADGAGSITVDDSGNVYVTGGSTNLNLTVDLTTIKYNSDGDSLWVRRWNRTPPGNETSFEIIVDCLGYVYVSGSSTLKYDRNGNLIWESPNNAGAFGGIVIDDFGNVFVGATNSNFDYVTIKFNNTGNLIWQMLYNGPANYDDRIEDISLDLWGNVTVTGGSWGVGTQWDWATIKYSNDGDSLWVRRYNGPAQDVPTDIAFALAVDDSGNVYVTGWSDGISEVPQCLTIKYSPEGETLWERRYPTGGAIGYIGFDILTDHEGSIYAAARANGYDDTLLKYDRQGNLLWTGVHQVNHAFATNPPRLALDNAGNIYMSSIDLGGGISKYLVLKYNAQGDQVWQAIYYTLPGPNEAYGLYADENGNVYVTGRSITPGQSYDYATVKFSQVTDIGPSSNEISGEFRLYQNYPNPFNPSTTIAYDSPHSGFVTLKIFNLLGQEVATLVNEHKSAGYYQVAFDAKGLASGVYLYRLQAGLFTQTKKMLLLR